LLISSSSNKPTYGETPQYISFSSIKVLLYKKKHDNTNNIE
jgi:hypothetical protein